MISSAIRWARNAVADLEAQPELLVSSMDLDDVLGTDYRRDEAVNVSHSCFVEVRSWVHNNKLAHVPMLIVQLNDSMELDIRAPSIDKLQEDIHEFTPPGLYMCRRTPGLGLPFGEEYALQVLQDTHTSTYGTVLCYYTCSRSLEIRELDGEYTRTVKFVYDRLAGTNSPERLVW